jgi:hypothetical protein
LREYILSLGDTSGGPEAITAMDSYVADISDLKAACERTDSEDLPIASRASRHTTYDNDEAAEAVRSPL